MKKTFEIECKAWVDDPEELRKKLNEKYEYKTKYTKEDTYYNFPGRKNAFRVRLQENSTIVTMKRKSRLHGIEENLETEFTVSDREGFLQFLEEFRCLVYVKKKKSSEVYRSGEITIELSFIDRLGWFLEVEKLVVLTEDRDVSEEKADAKESVMDVLESLGVSTDKIEDRYYTELLTGITEK